MRSRIPLSLLLPACLALPTAITFAQRPLPTLTDADVAHLQRTLPSKATAKPAQPRRLLIYNFTRGVYHDEAIAWATRALELMGEKTGAFITTASVDASVFTPERLREFDAVVMNNTMLNVFGPPEVEEARMRALVDFVRGGKGLIGIHSASVWENDPANPTETEFRQLIGGRFRNHPWESEPASIRIEDPAHPLNAAWAGKAALPLPWQDELFQFDPPYSRSKVRVLASLDLSETTDKGQRPDKDYPLAWIQACGKGRSFYSALGHNRNAFRDPVFLRFLQDGVQFALGDLPADTTPVPQPGTDLEKGFVPIFNGQDLTGWRGDTNYWSVQDGCITGITPQGGIKENNFLIWTNREPAEFDLKCSYKLQGGNSGIYFHAKERAPGSKAEALVGVQADMSADHVWTGVVMEYLLREKLAERGRKVLYTDKGERKDAGSVGDPKELLKVVRDNDWNDYHVIVRSNLIVLRINDVVMSEVRDHEPRRALSGLLAVQVHTGPPMKVQFKNLRIREFKP
ncbi:MAG: ThuA domain-containing protein [Verrucomicrobiia bacterium]